jgi:hypothetical protein
VNVSPPARNPDVPFVADARAQIVVYLLLHEPPVRFVGGAALLALPEVVAAAVAHPTMINVSPLCQLQGFSKAKGSSALTVLIDQRIPSRAADAP